MRPVTFAEVDLVTLGGVPIGSISRLALEETEKLDRQWTWFVVMNGAFHAGRSESRAEARTAIDAAVRSLGGGGGHAQG